MNRKFKKFLCILLSVICCLLFAVPSHAADEFTAKYDVTYKVETSGLTSVSQKISLINKLSNVYVTEYSLSIASMNIQNVKARDGLGDLKVSTTESEETTTIRLVFNEKIVGKDKALNFTLDYEATDLTKKKGQIWEVIIPKVTNIEEIDDYSLKLDIPLDLGRAAYLSPKPARSQPPLYFFDKTAATKGIMAAFGECQIFDFQISYHLKNTNITSKKMFITLPPETDYQKIIYQNIEPKPEDIFVDPDGNWLASYELKPKENIDIITSGSAQILMKSQNGEHRTQSLENYLLPQEYWEVNDPKILELAKKLKTAKKIYDFVVETLSYNYERIGKAERLGAIKALTDPGSALCMEFTDLFITLCRAAGIPAREVNGFAYTENPQLKPLSLKEDILHAWPEYWDEKNKVWKPVDPTWEKTTGGIDFFNKLDLNHFAFVFHGMKSDFPQAPGEDPEKNVEVSFAESLQKIKEETQVEFNLPEKAIAGFPVSGNIVIENTGNVAFHDLNLTINSQSLSVDILPPFDSRSFPINLEKTNWWQSKLEKVIVDINQYHFEKEVEIKPFFFQIGSFLTKLLFHAKNLFR